VVHPAAPPPRPPGRHAARVCAGVCAGLAAVLLAGLACGGEEPSPAPAGDDVRLIPGLFGSAPATARDALPPAGDTHLDFTGWTRSHGDHGSTKYSTLDQIDRDNVSSLAVAWTFDANPGGDDANWHYAVQTNPIVVGQTLYATTPANAVVALDAVTGALRWEYRSAQRPAHRGMVYWAGDEQTPPRLYLPAGRDIVALDARSGSLATGFGEGGRVTIGRATAAPAIAGDQLLASSNRPAALHGLDLRTGATRWQTPLRRFAGDGSGCAPWGGFSLDIRRKRAFLSTGNPRPAMHGPGRPGPNPHCNSVVAVDIEDGTIAWAFQEVAHDLWNFDIAAPPALATIEIEGQQVDVVAAATKIGNTLLLERDTGQPIFDYRLRRAPRSTIRGEETAEFQPDLQLPEPFMRAEFSQADITDITPKNRESVHWQLERASAGFFVPPIIGRSIIVFGLHGGAEWPGVAIDPRSQWMYATVNQLPWQLRMYLQAHVSKLPDGPHHDHYRERCASCHGPLRNGVLTIRGEAQVRFAPSLVGTTLFQTYADAYQLPRFRWRHRDVPDLNVTQDELDTLRDWFHELDLAGQRKAQIQPSYHASMLLDAEGYPGSKPPWGRVIALDLSTGRLRWDVPFGEYPELTARGIPPTGQANYGGLIVTAGGTVFATGTIDRMIRAFDSHTGTTLWQHELPAAGSAPPTTYAVDGRQYLAVMATGGTFHGFETRASQLVVFALPDPGDSGPSEDPAASPDAQRATPSGSRP